MCFPPRVLPPRVCSPLPNEKQLGAPLTPIGQLLAVLPAASSHCVPAACRALMTCDPAAHSPLADFYPDDFVLDPAGKPAELRWLWVALLPFIDEVRRRCCVVEEQL